MPVRRDQPPIFREYPHPQRTEVFLDQIISDAALGHGLALQPDLTLDVLCVVLGPNIFDLTGKKLYTLKGGNIYRPSGGLVGI